MAKKTIQVDYLARVEGEGAMVVEIEQGRVVDVRLKIFEPPRFFEALLRGRDFREAPDITARICGICPVAYQMSAVHAMEDALGVEIPEPIRELRRLLYCGEWIESHGLHVFMLHAPDFMGYPGAVEMARDHPELVKKGLRLKKAGNSLVSLLGGREIHPINVKVGGFYRAPRRSELSTLVPELEWGRQAALETIAWTSTLDFPEFEQDYEWVALRHASHYPFSRGRLVSNRGLDITPRAWDEHFEEKHVSYSNALHCVHKGHGAYHVGPLARYNLNFDRLSSDIQTAAREAGLSEVCQNPFQSIIVRSVELLYAFDEALRIIRGYAPIEPAVHVEPRAGTGYACTEAPRGVLYHRYTVDAEGNIEEALIVPPTSQNQKTIEQDLFHYVSDRVALDDETLTHQCEQAIRNYDPCISCATHFLNLDVKRR